MIGIDVDTGEVRRVCSFNAWHAAISRDGSRLVSDTTFPDNGLMVFDATDGVGERSRCARPRPRTRARTGDTDHCPYDDGPTTVYAPQHTHPHPAFSPDGRQVVFTSDRGGFAQVYVAEVPEALVVRRRRPYGGAEDLLASGGTTSRDSPSSATS